MTDSPKRLTAKELQHVRKKNALVCSEEHLPLLQGIRFGKTTAHHLWQSASDIPALLGHIAAIEEELAEARAKLDCAFRHELDAATARTELLLQGDKLEEARAEAQRYRAALIEIAELSENCSVDGCYVLHVLGVEIK